MKISGLMKNITPSLLLLACIGLTACNDKTSTTVEQPAFQCISAKITIADKQVDSVVQWNTKTGEARLLNAASFADKATGQQGNFCLLYTSPSPRDRTRSRMPSSA